MQTRIGCLIVYCFCVTSGILATGFDPGGFSVTIAPLGAGMRLQEEDNVTVRAFPMAFMDNIFALSQNQPGVLRLAFNNQPKVEIGTLKAFLQLPAEIKLLTIGHNISWISKNVSAGMIQYEIDVSALSRQINPRNYNIQSASALAMMLQTSAEPGSEWQAQYWLSNDDYVSPKWPLTMKVIPTISAPRPKRFQTGAHFTPSCIDFQGEAAQRYADFYEAIGCNAAMIVPGEFSQKLREKQVVRYYQPSGWLVNGFNIGMRPRPEEVRFQFQDGKKSSAVCPAVIYRQEEPYFTANLAEPLRKILVVDRDTDHFLSNWEPGGFDFKGCFCTRCQKDFSRFSKLSEEEVAAVWPESVIDKYRDLWIGFRAWQNAELVYTIEKLVNNLGREVGVDAHFITEVHVQSITKQWELSDSLRHYNTMAYAGQVPVLNAWGPYPWHVAMHPYSFIRGYNLSTYCVTRDAVDYLREQLIPARQPVLLGFPHGMQTYNLTAEPESIAIDILTHFFNEYDGQLIYAFPKGYDARYWRALAEANRVIATFEDFVFDGAAEKKHQVEMLTPYPKPSTRFLRAPCSAANQDQWADASMLQTWEYRLDQKRLLVLANYWQQGECLVKLSFADLADNDLFLLHEPLANRIYGNDTGASHLSASELRNGITIHVGGQRMVFLLLEPATTTAIPAATVVRPSQMASLLASRLPHIESAFDFQKPELGMAEISKSLHNFNQKRNHEWQVERVYSEELQHDFLQARSGKHIFSLDILGGGRVFSWQIDGVEVVNQDDTSGLVLDGLWFPEKLLTGPLNLGRIDFTDGDAEIGMTMPSVSPLSSFVELEKRITFSARDSSIVIKTTMHNNSTRAVVFVHRYHNRVQPLAGNKANSGIATFLGKEKLELERQFSNQLFVRQGSKVDDMLTKAFAMDKINQFDATEIAFTAADNSISLRVIWPPQGVQAVAFWDSLTTNCPAFELISPKITLESGDVWKTELKWTAQKNP